MHDRKVRRLASHGVVYFNSTFLSCRSSPSTHRYGHHSYGSAYTVTKNNDAGHYSMLAAKYSMQGDGVLPPYLRLAGTQVYAHPDNALGPGGCIIH